MKKLNGIIILILVLLLGLNNSFAGGGNRIGTGGASQLLIPVGVRGISMGEASVANTYGVDAIFWNPAGVAKMNNSASVAFSHMNYIADIGVEYGAVAANFEGFGTIGLSVKTLSIGDIDVTTTRDPDGTGTTYSPQHLIAGLTYSRQLTEKIGVGLTMNYITETLADVSASGVAFNIGIIYDNLAEITGLSIGVVMKNVGPQMKYDGSALYQQADVQDFNRPPQYYKVEAAPFELPSTFELGVAYQPKLLDDMNTLSFAGSFQNNNFSDDQYKLGLEYGYNKMFFLRAGYTFAPEQAVPDTYVYGFTAGAGIDYSFESISLKFDYAYRYAKYFDGNHVFGLSLGF